MAKGQCRQQILRYPLVFRRSLITDTCSLSERCQTHLIFSSTSMRLMRLHALKCGAQMTISGMCSTLPRISPERAFSHTNARSSRLAQAVQDSHSSQASRKVYLSTCEDATNSLAAALALGICKGDVICLHGTVGAGKSAFR